MQRKQRNYRIGSPLSSNGTKSERRYLPAKRLPIATPYSSHPHPNQLLKRCHVPQPARSESLARKISACRPLSYHISYTLSSLPKSQHHHPEAAPFPPIYLFSINSAQRIPDIRPFCSI